MAFSPYITLPPGAMTERVTSSPALILSSTLRNPSMPSCAIISFRSLPSFSCITISTSTKENPSLLASSTPMVLLPDDGMPIMVMFGFTLFSSLQSFSYHSAFSPAFSPNIQSFPASFPAQNTPRGNSSQVRMH